MISFLREYADSAPREYAEFVLMRELGLDIDALPAWRVDQAMHFLSLEARHRKQPESSKRP